MYYDFRYLDKHLRYVFHLGNYRSGRHTIKFKHISFPVSSADQSKFQKTPQEITKSHEVFLHVYSDGIKIGRIKISKRNMIGI